MNTRHIGIHLEADLASFPVAPQSFQQPRRVRCPRKRAEKSAITRLQDIGGSGETAPGEQGREKAALRCAASMKTLYHGAFLRGHEASRHRSGDAERMMHLHRIELEQLSCCDRSDEST